MAKKNEGRVFEEDMEKSAKKLGIFCSRNRDIFIPPQYRKEIQVPKNPYDYIMFSDYLFSLELKSTKDKSFSFSESIIKQHQIDNLKEAVKYDKVISGFIFNFRQPENKAYFVDIDSFIKYKNIAENQLKHSYKSKINKSSIPLSICEEIGLEIKSYIPRTRHHYHIKDFVKEAIEKYGGGD